MANPLDDLRIEMLAEMIRASRRSGIDLESIRETLALLGVNSNIVEEAIKLSFEI